MKIILLSLLVAIVFILKSSVARYLHDTSTIDDIFPRQWTEPEEQVMSTQPDAVRMKSWSDPSPTGRRQTQHDGSPNRVSHPAPTEESSSSDDKRATIRDVLSFWPSLMYEVIFQPNTVETDGARTKNVIGITKQVPVAE